MTGAERRRSRWVGGMALACGLSLMLSACGGDSAAPSAGDGEAGGDAKIGVVIKGLDNPFFQHMEDGIEAAAEDSGVEYTIQAAASITDTSGQADKLSNLANQDYDCYVVNPISGTNLVQGIAQIAAKDKTIVNIDNPVEAEAAKAADATIATYIGTDNLAAGKMVADQLATLAPEGGDVATVGGVAGDVTSAQRIDGFKEGLSQDFTVVQEVAADWNRQEAQTQAETILRANPELAAFFVANDDMAMGVARAVAAADRKGETLVVSVDGIDGVASGDIDAAVAQYPFVVGKMGMQACEAAAAGHELPAKVDTPIELITPENAKEAQEAFPEPPSDYENPFADLLEG
ncbi:substrate-binding domain-containing protein [Ornithinimicrobium cavernae]|uniref:substrate-binding domain-containing protein n=1 Tax=Ornithinimicrobium cavernae TaxID=2666047 RepID=UPI00137B2341|nr:substrate-binding domain-containing protein [Ornithinimicrobium cavernae]